MCGDGALCGDGTRRDDRGVAAVLVAVAAVVLVAAVLVAAALAARAQAHHQSTQKFAAVAVGDSFAEEDFVLVLVLVLALGSFSKRASDFTRSTSHILPAPPF